MPALGASFELEIFGERKKAHLMDYLFVKLFWYLVTAFAIGVFVGWFSCSEGDDGRTSS